MLENMTNFGQRATIGSIVTLLVWLIIYLSYTFPFLYIALITASICGALLELYRICETKKFKPLVSAAIGFSIFYAVIVYYSLHMPKLEWMPIATLFAAVISIFSYYLIKGSNPISNIAMTIFGIVYLTIPLACLIKINYFFINDHSQDGRCWLLYLLFVTKMTDTGAYFIGKWIGTKPLAPYLSPKKTLEGALGGLLTSVVFSFIFYLLAQNFPHVWLMKITFMQSIWLGVLISLISQFGDLAESLLKRDAGLKDSNTLPGLGGVLDMVDSLIFSAPLLYLFLKWSFI